MTNNRFLIIVSFCLIVSLPVAAQSTTGSIGGKVVDQSGAVVPDAVVRVENSQTGVARSAKTNADGQFLFPTLQVGKYVLRVEKVGFSTYVQEGITVAVDQAVSQTVALSVGAVGERISVNADAEIIETSDATSGQFVDEKKITDLPLNGRQTQALVYLAPGTVNTTSRYCGYNCFGGVYPGEQQAAVNGTGPGQINYQLDGGGHNDTYLDMNLPFPNPDAVQEFNMDADNLSAQYGGAAGGVVNIVTRSGSNQIHGDAFEFIRNGAVNARNFFAATSDTLKRNQFGGAIGGPIIKNKLFYFGTYQGTRIRSAAQGQIAFVPTAAERTGDFSDLLPKVQLKDPVTGVPFPNNQLPSINPITQKLLSYIPLPNGSGRQVSYPGPALTQNDNQYLAKVDYTIGKHQISGRYFDTNFTDTPFQFTSNLLQADANGAHIHIHNVAANDTYTLRPTLLFNTQFSWNSQIGGTAPAAKFGWPDIGVNIAQPTGVPPESYLSIGGAFTSNTNWLGQFDRGDYTIRENVTLIKGAHEMHFGAEYTRLDKHIVNTYRQGGFFSFTGNLSGDNLADFILGRVTQFVQGGGEYTYLSGNRVAAYAQDNWRVNPRLTINFGVRWDPFFPYQEQYGKVACYEPGVKSNRFTNAPLGVVYGGDPGCPAAGTDNSIGNFAPRLGLAYRLTSDGKTAIRAGSGFYYSIPSSDSFTQQTNTPFSPQITLLNVLFQDPYGSAGVANPFPAQYATNAPPANANFPQPVSLSNTLPRDMKIPLVTTWNVAVERQLANDMLLRVAYVGNKGTYMGPSDFYQNARELNPAVYIPGASTTSNTQARRLNPGLGSMTQIPNGHNSHYNALQVALNKRFSHGFTLLANYTWAKTIDDFGWANSYNREFNHGISNDDIPHLFKLAAVYQFPRALVSGFVDRVVNGWELTANTLWQAGFPLTITSGVDNSLSGVGRDRADFLGGAAQLDSGRSHAQMIAQWFDTSKFTANALGTFGNSGKNILRGPHLFNTDLSLLKNVKMYERVSMQLRFEFFNAFNNVNFNGPGTTVSNTAGFGRITSAGDPRILQAAAKIIF